MVRSTHETSLKPGDKAPAFSATDQHGKLISLDDFRNKKLVLYFYPKDDTPGCTAESCNLRDNYEKLQKEGYEIIGVSADSEKSHKKFAEKYNLPFPLLADTEKLIVKAYDVWGEKKFMGKTFEGIIRTTFVISKGKIDQVIKDVKTENHTDQILSSKTI